MYDSDFMPLSFTLYRMKQLNKVSIRPWKGEVHWSNDTQRSVCSWISRPMLISFTFGLYFCRDRLIGQSIASQYWLVALLFHFSVPPFAVEMLYAFIILMVLFGVGMSYELKRLECSLAFVAQISYMAYSLYANENLRYKPWLKVSYLLSTAQGA